jgi:two-component system KDP operon response regulator KdpE
VSGARVLVVDDELQLRRALRRSLEGHGYAVREAEDGAGALREAGSFKPDVILLDLVLPDTSGVEVCRTLRRSYDTPIIVLSVVESERAKVAALDEGADDYLTKPFGTDELLARVRVALRRGSAKLRQHEALAFDGLTVDLERRRVTCGEAEVHLTPTEYSLLKYMASNAGKVLTHPMILRAVWGAEYGSDTQLLRTYVNQLRGKLGEGYIRTEPGVGYRFAEPTES